MSALGQKRRHAITQAKSASPLKADMASLPRRLVPVPDVGPACCGWPKGAVHPSYLTTADASNLLLVFPGNDGLGTQSRYPRTFLAKGERVCRRAAMHLQILVAGGRLTWRYVANGSHLRVKSTRSRSAGGTEDADGMLSGQLFGPGGNTTPECWIDGRRMRAAPNARAIAEEAMPSKLGQSGVSS